MQSDRVIGDVNEPRNKDLWAYEVMFPLVNRLRKLLETSRNFLDLFHLQRPFRAVCGWYRHSLSHHKRAMPDHFEASTSLSDDPCLVW
jgi:hypothetical protein